MLRGGACHRGDQSRVVDELTVIGQQRPVQAVATHRRRQCDCRRGIDATRSRQHRCGRAREGSQTVTGRETEPDERPRCAVHLGQQRHKLRHRVHEVWGVACHQDSALERAAPGDADIAAGEVSQAAVHELGAPPAGAERQIVFLDQRHRQPTRRSVERNTGTGDTAADHEQVQRCAVAELL